MRLSDRPFWGGGSDHRQAQWSPRSFRWRACSPDGPGEVPAPGVRVVIGTGVDQKGDADMVMVAGVVMGLWMVMVQIPRMGVGVCLGGQCSRSVMDSLDSRGQRMGKH